MPAQHLRQTLEALRFPLDPPTRSAVHRCVCDYVDAMKRDNCLPERVLIGLKRIAEESGLQSGKGPTEAVRAARSDLLMDMITWSIERYYDLSSSESYPS